jgi:hypothetical protein
VHYLFNNLIANLFHQPLSSSDLFTTWKTLFHVSVQSNLSASPRLSVSETIRQATHLRNIKYIVLVTLTILLLLILNFVICICLTRRGHGCRKREYNCLNPHVVGQETSKSIAAAAAAAAQTGASPASTITQQLLVNTNYTTTNSSLSSASPVDMLHPVNVTKKSSFLRRSSRKRSSSFLPEAIV